MSDKIFHTLIFLNFLVGIYSSSLFNFLTGPTLKENDDNKNCICNGPSCNCCIDFNVSFSDLGGPGCIRINYLSPEEGVDLNVSYGNSLLHNERVTGPNPKPTCLNIISSFVQICAKIFNFKAYQDGLEGCLQLEPTLIGEAQIEFPIGCFKMSQNGIIVDKFPENTRTVEDENEQNSTEIKNKVSTEVITGLNAQDIIKAVNETANHGIALLTSWVGLAPSETKSNNIIATIKNSVPEIE